MIVVSDTSPITNLVAISQLNLLQQLYSHLIIPKAVYNEMVKVDQSSLRIGTGDAEGKGEALRTPTAPTGDAEGKSKALRTFCFQGGSIREIGWVRL